MKLPLNYVGWRCVNVTFRSDLGYVYNASNPLTKIRFTAPNSGNGVFYFDYFQVLNPVLWNRSSDQFVANNGGGPDLNAPLSIPIPSAPNITQAEINDANTIANKLENLYIDTTVVGLNDSVNKALFRLRVTKTKNWIEPLVPAPGNNNDFSKYVFERPVAGAINLYTDASKTTGVGFQMATMLNSRLTTADLTSYIILQLALDYKINGTPVSKQRCIDFFDWMYDQGWARGSNMGSVNGHNFTNVVHAFFLLRNDLPPTTRQNMFDALYWYMRYGNLYTTYTTNMETIGADEIRGGAIAKLELALCFNNVNDRIASLRSCRSFFNYILANQPGYVGVFKPDFSAYHHQQNYMTPYADEALHIANLTYYLLSNTAFCLDHSIYDILKGTCLRYDFVSTNLRTPAATAGRFPDARQNMGSLVPSYVYLIGSTVSGDNELMGAYKRIYNANTYLFNDLWFQTLPSSSPGSAFTAFLGTSKSMLLTSESNQAPANADPEGTVFMPNAGLFVGRKNGWLATVKGFSKYITQLECIRNEGRYSRYASYGHFQLSNIQGKDGYTPNNNWDWNHFPGTTSIILPETELDISQSGSNAIGKNWAFGDQAHLGGGALNDSTGMFSVHLHDITWPSSDFKAKKSVFYFGDFIYFLGSNINNLATQETHTTLFQNQIINAATEQCFLNGSSTSISGLNIIPTTSSFTTIKDNWGNAYIVEPSNNNLIVDRRTQSTFKNNTGGSTASADYYIAYLKHNTTPSSDGYRYALMIQPTNQQVQNMATAGNFPIQVIKQDYAAHIIYHKTRNIYAYSVFGTLDISTAGILKKTYQACIIMETGSAGGIKTIMFQDPDLRREPGTGITNQAITGTLRRDSIDLDGKYELLQAVVGVSTTYFASTRITRLYFDAIEGNQFILKLSTQTQDAIAFTPNNIAVVRSDGYPSTNGTDVYVDEYNPNGTKVQSIFINNLLQPASLPNTEDGYLTLSGDGQYLGLVGYSRGSSQGLNKSRFDTLYRQAAIVKYDGSYSSKSFNPTNMSLDKNFQPRSLYTTNGTDVWISYGDTAGTFGGIAYGTANTTSNPMSVRCITPWSNTSSVRQLNIDKNKLLYYNTDGTTKLKYFNSTTLPKSTADVYNTLSVTSINALAGAKGFCFVDNATTELLYVAINGSTNAGIIKYRKNAATSLWDSVGKFGVSADNYFSVAATVAADGKVKLFAVRKNANSNEAGELVAITDDWATNMSTATLSVIVPAGKYYFRGISLVPVQSSSVATASVASNSFPQADSAGNAKFAVFPNPAFTQITVEFESLVTANAVMQLYDYTGKLSKQITVPIGIGRIGVKMDVSDLPKGWYTIRMVTPLKQFKSSFIKQ